MRKNNTQTRRLAALLLLASAGGCVSGGEKSARVSDPFLATPRAVVAAPSNATSLEPKLSPLPAVSDEQALQSSTTWKVKLTAFEGENANPEVEELEPPAGLPILPSAESDRVAPGGVYPIDLANALGLGGATNLQVRIARTQLFRAQARHFEAKTLWLPSIRFGVGYNKHDGSIQATEGDVIEAPRNSLFYGGGLGLGAAPLAAGSGGPPRLFVNLSLADAYFKPLAACQEVAAHGAAERAASNDSLAEIAEGYYSLVEAHGLLANAAAAQDLTKNMVGLVEDFERQGFSSKTEVFRAQTELGRRQREVADAERLSIVRSADLARVLRLPAQVHLAPVEEFVMPIEMVDAGMDADALIAIAMGSRPEVRQYAALREAACFRVREEHWRPWIPNVQAGASGGGFGGGPSTDFPGTTSRSDVDLLAVWEWKNLGLGNVALQRQRRGQLHQRVLELEAVRDRIAAEVVAASADVVSYRRQLEIARDAIVAAQQSYQLNEQRIRASEGLPIELLQSISALADARDAYTAAVANYNRAQYRLIRAMGNPATAPIAEAIPVTGADPEVG